VRLYLDANAIIYAVEGRADLRDLVLSWTDRAAQSRDGVVMTSRVSLSECFALPYRRRDQEAVAAMQTFFTGTIELLSVDDALIDAAALLHREFSFKTLDAIHVASAIRAKADFLLTADASIYRYPDLSGVRCEAIRF